MSSTKMKAKSSRHKLNLTRTVKEYNESTSLHGLKYTTEYNRHSFERVFWMIVVVAFLTLGIFLTIRIVNKWQTSPIITTIESTNYPLSKGQLISKYLFGVFNSSKNERKPFDLR